MPPLRDRLGLCLAYVEGLFHVGVEREVLVGKIDRNLFPPAIIAAMLVGEKSWSVLVSFCEAVMFQKAAELEWKRADPERSVGWNLNRHDVVSGGLI